MAAKVMIKTYAGVLPTLKNSNLRPVRLDYFSHFINLKCLDFFYGNALSKLKDHEKKVIDNTVDKYWSVIKENSNSLQRDDLKTAALEAVWNSTEKYLVGVEKWNVKGKTKDTFIKVDYQKNFTFCKFANEQIKFKLRLIIYKDRINSSSIKLPDSDSTRSIYFNLNKWKIENNIHQKKSLDESDIKLICKKYNKKFNDVKLINDYQSQIIIYGDDKISEDSNDNYWDICEDTKINNEKALNNKVLIDNYKKLQKRFLLSISKRDRIILLGYKLNEKYTLKELSLKFNISMEAVRKTSERRFEDLTKFIKYYKKEFIDKETGKLNLI